MYVTFFDNASALRVSRTLTPPHIPRVNDTVVIGGKSWLVQHMKFNYDKMTVHIYVVQL